MNAGGTNGQLIWANLLHLGYNVYADWAAPDWAAKWEYVDYQPHLRVDQSLWDDVVAAMAASGFNMAVIELADGIRYESHPEIAVEGAWTVDQLRGELAKMRALGLEPIPKFNFSTAHDAWLGPYARLISTDTYYKVCADLIAEAMRIFDRPRLLHLGMDEENLECQEAYEHVVIRQHDLYWRDTYFFVEQVEKAGARAWVWSDYLWQHPEDYLKKMPTSVVQSNWYYEEEFDTNRIPVRAYLDLEAAGFDQIPASANWPDPINSGSTASSRNPRNTVEFCTERIAPQRLLGFMQTAWKPLLEAKRQFHMDAIGQVAQVAPGSRARSSA